MVDYVGNILDAASRTRLLSMQKTAGQLDVAFACLNSGLKINSALDDPNAFFLSKALRNRAGDLSRLLDGIGQNIRVIEEADNGIRAQLKNLDLAQSYLEDIIAKYNAGGLPSGGLAPNETMVTFNGPGDFTTYVAGQDAGGTVTVTGNNEVQFAGGSPWKRKAFNYNITANTVMTFEFRSTAINEVSTIGFDNDQNFGNDNNRFWIYGTQTSGITYAAPFTTYEYSDLGNWEAIEIPVGTFFTGAFSHINFVSDDDAAPFGNSAYRNIILREGPKQEGVNLSQFTAGYATILGQLDDIARDAHYRGVNLLTGEKMTTFFNEKGTSKLVTEGIDATLRGLGLTKDGFSTISQVYAELDKVRAAKKELRDFGTTLSTDLNIIQIRERFTEESINVHKEGADDLTLADPNEEGANVLALQTRQQLQMIMMSMRPRSVLEVLA